MIYMYNVHCTYKRMIEKWAFSKSLLIWVAKKFREIFFKIFDAKIDKKPFSTNGPLRLLLARFTTLLLLLSCTNLILSV